MQKISIDIETYSSNDIKCGVYKYVEAEDFELLLFSYKIDDEETKLVDIKNGESIPDILKLNLNNPKVEKWAFNANFERVCLSKYLGSRLNPRGWYCSAVWSSYVGIPGSLESVGATLGLDKQKLKEGKDLIKYFCSPCAPTKINGQRTRNLPAHAPDKWELFKEYNIRDVDTERGIQDRLKRLPVPAKVWEEYWLDQDINDRGVMIDKHFVENAIDFNTKYSQELTEEAVRLTGIGNPNSVTQLRAWLSDNGVDSDKLDKAAVKDLLNSDISPQVKRVLEIRADLSKTSVKKYEAMLKSARLDDTIGGLFQFYGASRTGRFAGRNVQLQNLPQNHIEDLDEARALVSKGDYESFSLLYNVPSTLSELIRTALVPKTNRFIVADFSAIEARVIAWLAGEEWRQEVFANGGDIYCASASKMFKVPVVKHGINGHLRQKGKVAELACGYGGGTGALIQMGALDMGIPEEELQGLIDDWRASNTNIVQLWKDTEAAAKSAVKGYRDRSNGIAFRREAGMLILTLPSGRELFYPRARLGTNRFGSPSIIYEGPNTNKNWSELETYGGKLVENIVQAIARDLLMYSMQNLDKEGYRIVAHVHDEVIIEAQEGQTLEEASEIMARIPDWAKGLLLRADGYYCSYYMKD